MTAVAARLLLYALVRKVDRCCTPTARVGYLACPHNSFQQICRLVEENYTSIDAKQFQAIAVLVLVLVVLVGCAASLQGFLVQT